jgi:hypothetical protein
MRRIARIAVVAWSSLLLACSGPAAPVQTVDGINFPVGNVIDTELNLGTLVTVLGGSFSSLGKVTLISDMSLNRTWRTGTNGKYMSFVLTGFTVTSIALSGAAFTVTLSGGSLRYYVSNSDPDVATGTQATDFANITSGALWLNLIPDKLDAAGNTLLMTIPASNSLTDLGSASVQAIFDVNKAIPGEAGIHFETCTVMNTFASGGCADARFIGSTTFGVSGDFALSGSGALKTNVLN